MAVIRPIESDSVNFDGGEIEVVFSHVFLTGRLLKKVPENNGVLTR